MLSKTRRIERKSFKNILTEGKRYNSKSFILYLAKIGSHGSETPTKVAFSVSKKVIKSAVGRNRQRRRGYSILGKYLQRLKPGFYMFFVYKKEFEKDYSILEEEIKGLLSSATVII